MTASSPAVRLASELIAFDTGAPDGGEEACAYFVGALLEQAGFSVHYQPAAPGQVNCIARLPGRGDGSALCLCGHLDTVPAHSAAWTTDPHTPVIVDGRLYGRGASDMKGGIAAIVIAALDQAARRLSQRDLLLVFTAGEESGCLGARVLCRQPELLGDVGALIIAEPTSNRPMLGHKGALWLEAVTRGVAAHGSMPERGVNAIYRAARSVLRLEALEFPGASHPILGRPTVNVGTIAGGSRINIVPDFARIEIDIRTIPGMDHEQVREEVAAALGASVEIQLLLGAPGVWTEADNPWVRSVFAIATAILGSSPQVGAVPYFTDASVLLPALAHPPALILGPGDAAMAHKSDECCTVALIDEAVELYGQVIQAWCG